VAASSAVLEASADERAASGKEPREYRLVDDRVEAAKLDHARLTRTIITRGDRTNSFTLGLSGGARTMGLDELNRDLERNGYSTTGTFATFGFGGAYVGRKAFFGFFLDGGRNSIRSTDGTMGSVSFFDVMLQGGPVFSIGSAALAYPYAGLGMGSMNVSAGADDPARTPILRDRIAALPLGFSVGSLLGIVELGVGSFISLPIVNRVDGRYGIALGTEVGYTFSFAESDWNDGRAAAGAQVTSYSGPSSAVSGPMVRLLVRYVYDGFVVHGGHETMASCKGRGCQVVCERGFSDCDGDPRNGCETELGTMENCGGCGDACIVRHGLGVCANQECELASCEPGFTNCTPLDRCASGKCIPKSESHGAP
jgi:hypothetical protein